jgi:hypothetical protein
MAKEIDLTKPLSEFDLRYLVSRDRWNDIRTNARNLGIAEPAMPNKRDIRAQVPKTGVNARKRDDTFEAIKKALGIKGADDAPGEEGTPEEGGKVDYKKLTVPQLKEELDKRRADYEASGDTEAVEEVSYTNEDRKDDLVAKLELDDEVSTEDDGE